MSSTLSTKDNQKIESILSEMDIVVDPKSNKTLSEIVDMLPASIKEMVECMDDLAHGVFGNYQILKVFPNCRYTYRFNGEQKYANIPPKYGRGKYSTERVIIADLGCPVMIYDINAEDFVEALHECPKHFNLSKARVKEAIIESDFLLKINKTSRQGFLELDVIKYMKKVHDIDMHLDGMKRLAQFGVRQRLYMPALTADAKTTFINPARMKGIAEAVEKWKDEREFTCDTFTQDAIAEKGLKDFDTVGKRIKKQYTMDTIKMNLPMSSKIFVDTKVVIANINSER